ncbi:AAA family ATPase, partial [Flavihumibacter sp. CACIAM 22H1]|uniref:AAA family ATPase n=1 Tax=Flavihumibacter sp. CACIAM 22H1 TaxID=1812911 RepID=UPI000B271642
MIVAINKFKKIDSAELELGQINIFIGTNNSGKSSFIQGIQFAISSCQTLKIKGGNWKRHPESFTLSLDSTDFIYTPTRHIGNLYHGKRLTGSRTRDSRNKISFSLTENDSSSTLEIMRGKNGGFTTVLHNKS